MCKPAYSKCDEKANVSKAWHTRRHTRRGYLAGRTLTRHIRCVRLTAASHEPPAYHKEPGVNTSNLISPTVRDPGKTLFNVNAFVNSSYSESK